MTSLNKSVVNGLGFTKASTSTRRKHKDLSLRLTPWVFSSDSEIFLAVLICLSHMPPICYLQVDYSFTTSTHYRYLVWTDWFSDDSDGSFSSEGERFGRVQWRPNKIVSITRFEKSGISSASNKSSQIHDKGISAQQFCSFNMDSSTEKTIKQCFNRFISFRLSTKKVNTTVAERELFIHSIFGSKAIFFNWNLPLRG